MKRIVFSLVFVILPSMAAAQAVQNIVLRNSFNPAGAGARGAGMGGAFIAVADDGTAASFNPAGLAQLRRSEFALVGFWDQTRTTRTDVFTERSVTDTLDHANPEFVGLAVPFDVGGRNMTVQLSYQRSVDLFGKGAATTRDFVSLRELGIPAPGTAELRGDITPEQSGAFHTVSATVAYQASPHIALGLSLNYWFADWTAQGRASFRISTVAIPGVPSILLRSDVRDFVQQQRMDGLNANVGVLLKWSWLSLGANLRLPFTGNYDLEESGVYTATEFGRPPVSEPVEFTSVNRLNVPAGIGLGVALRPLRGLTLAGDYARVSWTQMILDDVVSGSLLTPSPEPEVEGEDPPLELVNRNFFDLAPASVTSTEDTETFRGGIEYLITAPKVVIPLRAGIFREESPVSDLSQNTARRTDGWTVGTGFNFARVVLDVAFQRRETEGVVGLVFRGQGESAATTEKVRDDKVIASLIYRFGGDDDPVAGLFRKLFGSGSDETP